MTRSGRHTYAGLSDVGRVRTHNEDTVLLSPPLFAVADGLGGHQAGEIASSVAVEALADDAPARSDAKALGRAVRTANRAVLDAAREGHGRSGMGTTITAALVEGTRIAIAHVGDSRAYLFHDDRLERITQDHSMVADMIRQGTLTEDESRVHPNRSVITRALGSDPNMFADTYEVDARPNDRLLLCSDGLTGMLDDDRIASIMREYRDPESTTRALVDAANAAGGHDNISVVVVDITGDAADTAPGDGKTRTWLSAAIWFFAALALVFTAGWGAYRYAQTRAFVIAENGVVMLYRGLPGEVLGRDLRWLEEETTITAQALGPVTSARLAQGIPVEGVEVGRELLAEYRSRVGTTPPGAPDADDAEDSSAGSGS